MDRVRVAGFGPCSNAWATWVSISSSVISSASLEPSMLVALVLGVMMLVALQAAPSKNSRGGRGGRGEAFAPCMLFSLLPLFVMFNRSIASSASIARSKSRVAVFLSRTDRADADNGFRFQEFGHHPAGPSVSNHVGRFVGCHFFPSNSRISCFDSIANCSSRKMGASSSASSSSSSASASALLAKQIIPLHFRRAVGPGFVRRSHRLPLGGHSHCFQAASALPTSVVRD